MRFVWVDEAHCVDTWAGFRASYQRLGSNLRQILGTDGGARYTNNACIIASSASMTRRSLQILIEQGILRHKFKYTMLSSSREL